MNIYRVSDRPQSLCAGSSSPAEADEVIARLKDKSIDDLRKPLTDKNAYGAFFNSLDQVEVQNNLHHELLEETLQLARENLEKETRMSELRNQCRIIRTTELAAAQERLKELEKQEEEILRSYSPASLLQNLQDAMNKAEDESEALHGKLIEKELTWQLLFRSTRSFVTLTTEEPLPTLLRGPQSCEYLACSYFIMVTIQVHDSCCP